MTRCILLLCQIPLLWVTGGFTEVLEIDPTVGRPWPIPQVENKGERVLLIDPDEFMFKATGNTCETLRKAFVRYEDISFPERNQKKQKRVRREDSIPNIIFEDNKLSSLEVNLTSKCEDYPHLNMIEEYELKICSFPNLNKGVLHSQSIWGILRGLETFSQIVYIKGPFYVVKCTQIVDFPRFPHRGMLLDTSRHYLPVKKILENLDLMSMNKFNVFHWHIVDDNSFPYVSSVYPDLSSKGAWSEIHVYTKKDIALVVDYARDLGIRVIPEFDTPGHTRSWGKGHPGLLTRCYGNSDGSSTGRVGPIDPSNEANFEFLQKLFQEISSRFPDSFLHLGGDEVSYDCWQSNPDIRDFVKSSEFEGSYTKLEEFYMGRLIGIIRNLTTPKGYIVWEEVFNKGIKIPHDTIIQIWKGEFFNANVKSATSAGHRVIWSSCWYLDARTDGDDWFNTFYSCDPHNFGGNEEDDKLILGGEACVWGEFIDSANLISHSWPRAAPVAEKLWSPEHKTRYFRDAAPRLAEHRCRLLKRGYSVAPFAPSFCSGIL